MEKAKIPLIPAGKSAILEYGGGKYLVRVEKSAWGNNGRLSYQVEVLDVITTCGTFGSMRVGESVVIVKNVRRLPHLTWGWQIREAPSLMIVSKGNMLRA